MCGQARAAVKNCSLLLLPLTPLFTQPAISKVILKRGIQVAEDKTFGLKNKNKSAKVQQ